MKLHPDFHERVLHDAPVAVIVWRLRDPEDDASLVLVFANAAAEKFTKMPLVEKVGQRFDEVFPRLDPRRRKVYADVVRTGVPYEDIVETTLASEREVFGVKATKLGDDAVVYFENFTQVRRNEARATRTASFLDALFDHVPLMIFLKEGEQLRFERMNRAGEELLGVTRDKLLGKNDYDFFPKEQADFFTNADRETLRAKVVVDIPEEPIDTPRGVRWLHTKKVGIYGPDGEPSHLLGISTDITEQRAAAAALKQAKQAAEEASKSLETFSYSVAHDLRAPLRAIDGFSQALLEDEADRLSQEGRESLGRVRRAAMRMAELIDDLLRLSRVSRSELTRAEVDLSSLAKDVFAQISSHYEGRAFDLRVADGLVTRADARLARILLENLLGNAAKFTSRCESATIEVGVENKDGFRAFFVRDNGAGFDPQYAAKLFGPFERLHSAAEFDGSGIGLAIAQRIVERHAGKIWARGAVDGGATFWFSLAEE